MQQDYSPKVRSCNHELDLASIEFDKRFGRKGKCKHCGCKMVAWRYAELKHNKERMSKKERRRRKAQEDLPPLSSFRGTGKTETKMQFLGVSPEEKRED